MESSADGSRSGPRLCSIKPTGTMLRTLCFSLLAVLLASPVLAQSNAEAMQRLAPLNGTYSLDGTAQIEEGTFDGSLTVSPILDGHFQQWDWEMVMRGEGVDETVHLRFIVEYDPGTDEYAIYRFDSRDADSPTRASNVEDPDRGTLQFEGDALVMAWPTSNPDDPTMTGRFRNVVRLVPDGLRVDTNVMLDTSDEPIAIATTRASRR